MNSTVSSNQASGHLSSGLGIGHMKELLAKMQKDKEGTSHPEPHPRGTQEQPKPPSSTKPPSPTKKPKEPRVVKENVVTSYKDFDCAKATTARCEEGVTKEMPFSLAYLDAFWKETHGGKLPGESDEEGFKVARWQEAEEEKALKAIEMGLPPPLPGHPGPGVLDSLYDPSSDGDRRLFYCWKMRSDPQFCRDLKLKAMPEAELGRKETKICSALTTCLAKNGPPYGFADNHKWTAFLYLRFKRVGGNVDRLKRDKEGGILAYLCHLLKQPSAGGTSESPIDLTIDPKDQKIRKAFCALVAKDVMALKMAIVYPPLSLPPDEYRKEIDRIFARFKYGVPELKNGCVFSKNKLLKYTKHQKFERAFVTPLNPVKGLLMYHAAGTGKTCAAVATLSTFLTFHETHPGQEPWKIVWISRASLISELPKSLFGDVCLGPIRAAVKDPKVHFGSAKTYEEKLHWAKDPANWDTLQKRFLAKGFSLENRFFYTQIVNAFTYKQSKSSPACSKPRCTEKARKVFRSGPDPLRRILLVFDEAHNLFNERDLPQEEALALGGKKTGVFGTDIPGREHIVNAIYNSYKVSGDNSCRVLLATATPMTPLPTDAFRLLNMLIPKAEDRLPKTHQELLAFRTKGGQPFVNKEGHITPEAKHEFMKRTNGILSYFSGNRNPQFFAMTRFHIVNVAVTAVQEHYLKECVVKETKGAKATNGVRKEKKKKTDAAKDVNKWSWEGFKEKFGGLKKKLKEDPKGRLEGVIEPGPKPTEPVIVLPPANAQNVDAARKAIQADLARIRKDPNAAVHIAPPPPTPIIKEGDTKPASIGGINLPEGLQKAKAESESSEKGGEVVKGGGEKVGEKEQVAKAGHHPEPFPVVKKEPKRHARVKPVVIPEDLSEAKKKKIGICMRDVANVAGIRGKLQPLDHELSAASQAHRAKEEEREAKAREAWRKKNSLDGEAMAKVKAWKEWDAMGDAPHPGPMPKDPEELPVWQAKEDARKAKMDAKPKGRRPTKATLAKYEATLKGETDKGFVFRAKATPRPKEGKSFSFTFDGKSFTPKIMVEAMGSYAPKVQKLMDKIAELDKEDLEKHGHLFKHFIYTDTQGPGRGSKVIAAAFVAAGFQRACWDDRKKEILPPKAGGKECKGTVKAEADTYAKGHTFALLASTSIDGIGRSGTISKATIDLFNSPDNTYGQDVRFIIADSGFKEGVDLYDVRYTHLMEPPLSQASLEQAVARAVRFCKSTHLKVYDKEPKGWWVDVYVYRSVYPAYMDDPDGGTKSDPSTIHQAVMDSFGSSSLSVSEFDNLLMTSAVDFQLNKAILLYKPKDIVNNIDKMKVDLHLD